HKPPLELNAHEKTIMSGCFVAPAGIRTRFDQIGGLGATKELIDDLIRLPLRHPQFFQHGILRQNTTGMLLFGPPGTGKTMLARAVAAESGAAFLNVQMSRITNMYVGESEKLVKAIFTLARKLQPCVIFIDEMDALLRARSSHNHGYETKNINEFMQEWDGIAS
ncbi:AAA-domain-containing protein, partial [Caulochytrium protostelioides]